MYIDVQIIYLFIIKLIIQPVLKSITFTFHEKQRQLILLMHYDITFVDCFANI